MQLSVLELFKGQVKLEEGDLRSNNSLFGRSGDFVSFVPSMLVTESKLGGIKLYIAFVLLLLPDLCR